MRIDRLPNLWSLGIDTSAYTTSVAAVSPDGHFVRQERRLLPVPQGSRGLRPSEALFRHVRDLPDLLDNLLQDLPIAGLQVVGVSTAPRPQPDSYLPTFLAGTLAAEAVALGRNVPLVRTTHQEGHIQAGLAGAGMNPCNPFLALHISGGTTELLRVDPTTVPWDIALMGGSDDLYAGQFVDRIGVLMGLPFPAGPAMDELAESAEDVVRVPWTRPRLSEGRWWTSFSGPESAAERLLGQGVNRQALARGVMEAISESLVALVTASAAPSQLLGVGGVAANTHLRRVMSQRLTEHGWQVGFAPPQWSRDNAVGVALLAWQRLQFLREGDVE